MGNINQTKKKQHNYSLDLLKFISSFLIVCIHFKFEGRLGEFVTVASRFAVPVFFMISGYYSYNNSHINIRKKIIGIIKIYFIAVVLYFCFNVFKMVYLGQIKEAIWYVSTYFRIRYTSKTILFNESISAMHLWFMGSLIYSYIIQYFVIKSKIRENSVYTFSCVLLLIHLVLGIGINAVGMETPAFLMKNYMLRNFLFMGFPLFTFGRFIRHKEDSILHFVSSKHIALLVMLSILDTIWVYRIDCTKDLYIGSLLLAFALFVVSLKTKDKTFTPAMTSVFGTSANVYLFHIMVGEVLAITPLENMQFYLYIRPVVIFVLSVFVSLMIKSLAVCIKRNMPGR